MFRGSSLQTSPELLVVIAAAVVVVIDVVIDVDVGEICFLASGHFSPTWTIFFGSFLLQQKLFFSFVENFFGRSNNS